MARNFDGLKLSIKLLLTGDWYCGSHPGLIENTNTIYHPIASCETKNENGFQVTCKQISCGGSTYIISVLTVMFPLKKDVTFAVMSGSNQQLDFIAIRVRSKLTRI